MPQLVLLGLATVAIGLAARVTERSWIAPATLFGLLWGAYLTAASPFVVDPERMVAGALWISCSCLVMYAGTAMSRAVGTPRRVPDVVRTGLMAPRFSYLTAIAWACVTCGVVELWYLFARQGFSARAVLSFAAIAQLTASNRSDYGYGDLQQGIIERLAFLALYTGPFFGGVLFKVGHGRTARYLSIALLAFPIMVGSLYGSRMGVLFAGSFWLASYLAMTVLEQAQGVRTDVRLFLRTGAVLAFLLLGVSLLVQALRYSARSTVDWSRMFADPFGFFAAFALWFDLEGFRATDLYLGARTFRRIVEVVGITQPIAPAIEVGFTSSNIYTVFRDLIEDFGSVGAMVFVFAYGALASLCFRRVTAGDLRAVPALALIFAFAFTSFAIPLFLYSVTTGAAVLFLIYFRGDRVRWSRRQPPLVEASP